MRPFFFIQAKRRTVMSGVVWVSTFPGVHNLKGGSDYLKIWIEEIGDSAALYSTKAGGFGGNISRKYGSLSEMKAAGEMIGAGK